jgi:hypothetical protein
MDYVHWISIAVVLLSVGLCGGADVAGVAVAKHVKCPRMSNWLSQMVKRSRTVCVRRFDAWLWGTLGDLSCGQLTPSKRSALRLSSVRYLSAFTCCFL